MNPSTTPSGGTTLEQSLSAMVGDLGHCFSKGCECCNDKIRESPGKAVMLALAAGYCAHRLPLRSLFMAQLRLTAALAPPALIAFGAAKVFELLQNRSQPRPTSVTENAGELLPGR